jgi:hypothetical protein
MKGVRSGAHSPDAEGVFALGKTLEETEARMDPAREHRHPARGVRESTQAPPRRRLVTTAAPTASWQTGCLAARADIASGRLAHRPDVTKGVPRWFMAGTAHVQTAV